MGRGRGKGKNINQPPVVSTQGAIKNQGSSSTEGGNENTRKGNEPYVLTSGSEVPSEKTSAQRITDFFEAWGHWVAWFGFVIIFSFSYANFDNDVKNSKIDISELKEKLKENNDTTADIEKTSVKQATEIGFIRNEISTINNEIYMIEKGLKDVEIEQARLKK